MFWPCETRTSICRNLATISSGLYRFLAIAVLLDVKDIPQVGSLQWGRSKTTDDNEAEEAKTSQIAFTYKRCLKERESEGYKKTYSQSEIDNYCGCFSVQINERVTMEEYKTATNDGTWQTHPVLKEV